VGSVPLKLADFTGRVASIEGVLLKNCAIDFQGELLHLTGLPAYMEKEGKRVFVKGRISQATKGWQLDVNTSKFVDLVDLVDQQVTLEGALWNKNGQWYFKYRGDELDLIHSRGPKLKFSDEHGHGRVVTVAGTLLRQLRRAPGQIIPGSDLVPIYVVRDAKVSLRDEARWDHRFQAVCWTECKVSEGVEELLAQSCPRRSEKVIRTRAVAFSEFNEEAICAIVQKATPQARDVVARRMHDASIDPILRLLYAAILARVNDQRGRDYLLERAKSPGNLSTREVDCCLGLFPFLGVPGGEAAPAECAWAEETLTVIRSDPNREREILGGPSVSWFLLRADVLVKANSSAARKQLLDTASRPWGQSNDTYPQASTIQLLCQPFARLSAPDLLRLESVTKRNSLRRGILRALLRLKHPSAAQCFCKDLEDFEIYLDFRDQIFPGIAATLKLELPLLNGQAKLRAQILELLAGEDPIPGLLALLHDPEFSNKQLVMEELARTADSRVLVPVAHILREAPVDYFSANQPRTATAGIAPALESIARIETRAAIRELIEMMSVDLSRFRGYLDGAGLRRVIAVHLIEMTGESFGVDQAAWRTWEKAQPDSRFHAFNLGRGKKEHFRVGPDDSIDLGR